MGVAYWTYLDSLGGGGRGCLPRIESANQGPVAHAVVPTEGYQPPTAGVQNITADEKLRVTKDRADWMLCPRIFNKINRKMSHLFAFTLNWRLCKPTMKPGGQCLAQVREQIVSVEIKGVVPNTPKNANPGTPLVTEQARLDITNAQDQQTRHHTWAISGNHKAYPKELQSSFWHHGNKVIWLLVQ